MAVHSRTLGSLILVVLGFHSLLMAVLLSAGGCDPRCSTSHCDDKGFCLCELPSNSTLLDGDRPFLGGEFCDERRIMCDGSNTFWCQNGDCNEVVQGENYTCICKEGYKGEHCELEGVPCGETFCYHNAACIQADVPCECPAEWKGSEDCSLPTVKRPTNNTVNATHVKDGEKGADKWYLPFSVAMVILVTVLGVICGLRALKRQKAATEFHKLREVQMRGFIEEDEEAFSHKPLSKAQVV